MAKSIQQMHRHGYLVLGAIILNVVMFLARLFTPVIQIRQMILFTDTFSIYLGIYALLSEKHILLGIIVLLFSIVFPFVKLTMLGAVWYFPFSREDRGRILDWLKILGKWSMLDVFVIAMTVVIAKLSGFADASAKYGIYIFASAVILSMLLTLYVDHEARQE